MADLEALQVNVRVWNRRLGTGVPIPTKLSAPCRTHTVEDAALGRCLYARGTSLTNEVLITVCSLVYTREHKSKWGVRLARVAAGAAAIDAYRLVAECLELRNETGGLMNVIHKPTRGVEVDTRD